MSKLKYKITKRKTKKNITKHNKKTKYNNYNKSYKPKILHNINYLRNKEKDLLCLLGKGTCNHNESITKEVDSCISFLPKIPDTPKIFIDIGAHKGLYTQEVLKKLPNIECYLFEPSPANTDILKNKFEKLNNVHISTKALSNITGKQKIYFDSPGSQITSLTQRRLDHFHMYMDYSEEIETIRFDEFWKHPNTFIDYVKIDVEGHELNVLEGFGDLIKNIGIIQFEFGGANIDTRTYFQDFWYFFKNKIYDFSIYRIAPNGLIPITHYSEYDECFITTNYIAVNNKINKNKTKRKSK